MRRRAFLASGLTLSGASLLPGCGETSTPGTNAPSNGGTSYLRRLGDVAPEQRFPLVYGWMNTEPRQFFAELRAERPILQTSTCTLVALYDDVIEVLRQPSVFTAQLYAPMMGDYLMAQDDTPIHTREKSIMTTVLNRDDLPRLRQLVAAKAKAVLDQAFGRCNFVGSLGRAMPIAVTQEYFGLDGVDPAKLIEWSYWNQCEAFKNQPFDNRQDANEIHARYKTAVAEFQAYLQQLVARRLDEIRRGVKRDDVTSRLLQASFPESVGFPLPRLVLNIGGLLIGAVETTSQASVQALRQLIRRPDRLAEAKAHAEAADNDRFDAHVWEALRFAPIGSYIFRKSAADYTLAKGTSRATRVQAGTTVLSLVQSAMFDSKYFPNADAFDPARPAHNLLHFGFGAHECMGKWVGMTMIPEIVRQAVLRSGLKEMGDIDFGGTPFPQRYEITWTTS